MKWPVDKFTISQGYHAGHTANDLAAPQGVPILAPTTGTINGVNKNAAGYFGGMYVIVNGDDGYRYYMGHCSAVDVAVGQRVSEGQKVGNVGATGQATGPHVHFEISKGGQTFDPSKLIGTQIQGGDEVIQNNDSSYDRWKLKMRHLWGDESAKRFTRDAFVRDYVGHTSDEMDDRLLHNPSAEARLRAGDVGALAIQGDWWNRLIAKPQASVSSEDIDKAVKEAQEALDAVNKLKK